MNPQPPDPKSGALSSWATNAYGYNLDKKMNNSIKFLVEEKDEGTRLDVFLAKEINYLTRTNIKKIIGSNNVKIRKKIIR